MKKSTKVFLAVYIILCLVNLGSFSFHLPKLAKAFLKVLPFFPLLWMMFKATPKEPLLIAGLIASMTGDVAVYWGGMIGQIAGFIIAQGIYAYAFSRYFKSNQHKQWFMVFILVIVVSLMGTTIVTGAINQHVPGALMTAICLYMVAIFMMAFFAVSQTRDNYMIYSIGALVFILSDGLIAVNQFVVPIPYKGYIIMATYYAAQLLICYNAATGKESRVD